MPRGALVVLLAALIAGCHDVNLAADATQVRRGLSAIEGIPENGFTLGKDDAPWTLSVISSPVSYELDQMITQLPEVIEQFVRSGRVKVQMRTPSAGPYAEPGAQRTAATLLAAGLQGRYWYALVRFVPAHRGRPDAHELATLLRRSGVADVDRAIDDRASPRIRATLARADAAAVAAGGQGRVVYLMTPRDGPVRNVTGDADKGRLAEAIARVLALKNGQ